LHQVGVSQRFLILAFSLFLRKPINDFLNYEQKLIWAGLKQADTGNGKGCITFIQAGSGLDIPPRRFSVGASAALERL
jgi:hypothetical protein